MKNVFFSIMAIAMMSMTAFAGGGKTTVKKHKATTTCPAGCPKSMGCHKGAPCPVMPGCVCS
jgi:hypothetical protein